MFFSLPQGVRKIATSLQWEVWAKGVAESSGQLAGSRTGSGSTFTTVSIPVPVPPVTSCWPGSTRNLFSGTYRWTVGLLVHLFTTLLGPISRSVTLERHQPSKWHLITDLSSPEGSIINDGIDPNLLSVSYTMWPVLPCTLGEAQ